MLKNIGVSSELYNIELEDIKSLPYKKIDYKFKDNNAVYILISDDGDSIVYGKEFLNKAEKENLTHIPVRVLFNLKFPIWKVHFTLIKALRDKFRIKSPNYYHIKPQDIRELNIERGYRDETNAHLHSDAIYLQAGNQLYLNLKKSIIENGYDDKFPMDVQLCRSYGVQDCLNQGHHRMGILIDNDIKRASIMFSAVGYIGNPLKPLLLKLAKKSLKKKRNK
tara:strand:- start:302 stop:967 length:666 start_codon:yes stop_codon:yes gene_type:complete